MPAAAAILLTRDQYISRQINFNHQLDATHYSAVNILGCQQLLPSY